MNNTNPSKRRGFDAEWAAELAATREQLMRSPRERFRQAHEHQDYRLTQEDAFEQLLDLAQVEC